MIRKQQFVCPYTMYDHADELNADDAELMRKAHEAARNAYAPYSNFHVGAAVRLANGLVVLGNNIENAAYPVASAPSEWLFLLPWRSIRACLSRPWPSRLGRPPSPSRSLSPLAGLAVR